MENIIYDRNRALDIAVTIGINMLKAGSEVGRVEKTMGYVLKAFGAEIVDSFSLPTLLLVSATFEGKTYESRIKRNLTNSRDLYRIEKYNSLSREICKKGLSFSEIEEKISYIENKKDYSLFLVLIGAFLSSFGFALFFGGGTNDTLWTKLIDSFISGIVGILIYLVNKIKLKHSNEILHTLIASLLGGLLCTLLYKINIVTNLSSVMIGVIMIVIPGINLFLSIRDIFIDDVMSGTLKFIESIATSLAIAAGFTCWTLIFNVDILLELSQDPLMMLLGGVIGVLGFSIILNSKYKRLPYALLIGSLITVFYIISIRYLKLNNLFSNLITAFIGGLLAEIFARIIKAPSTSFLIPAVVPLVPGGSLFFTMYYLINDNTDKFVSTLESTFITILSISLGIVASQIIFYNLYKKK